MTKGTESCPPDMYRILAALLTIWSRARMPKFIVMSSTIGRNPAIAAPMARPVKPASVIGVSITRPGPNSSMNPLLTLNAPW